jgi:hypothetical protein
MIEAVFERNPQARKRALDPNLREALELKARGVKGVIKRMTVAGLAPLQWIDTWTIIVGEEAVFEAEMARTGNEADAAAAAQEATQRTQPFGEEKDTPAAYTSNFFKALAMFSSPLNQIFGMATHDMPRDLARGHVGKVSLTLVSLAMTGVLMSIMEQKRIPDREEEPQEFWIAVASQFMEMVPIIGPEILGAARKSPFVGKGFSITGWARSMGPAFRKLTDDSATFEEKVDSAVKAAMAGSQLFGLPSVGMKRVYQVFRNETEGIDLWQLFGGAPED